MVAILDMWFSSGVEVNVAVKEWGMGLLGDNLLSKNLD